MAPERMDRTGEDVARRVRPLCYFHRGARLRRQPDRYYGHIRAARLRAVDQRSWPSALPVTPNPTILRVIRAERSRTGFDRE